MTFSNVQPDPEDKARDMSAAPIMGATSDVLSDFVSPGSLGCQSTTTADCIHTTRLQPPLLERKDHVEGQEGGTKDDPITDPNTAQKAGKLVQFDEEVYMRIALPHIKSTTRLHKAAGQG